MHALRGGVRIAARRRLPPPVPAGGPVGAAERRDGGEPDRQKYGQASGYAQYGQSPNPADNFPVYRHPLLLQRGFYRDQVLRFRHDVALGLLRYWDIGILGYWDIGILG